MVVNTIFCGNYNHGINSYWQAGALETNGDYMAIDHNAKTVHIPSPYDQEILQLNIQLNKTYIYYGKKGRSKAAVQAQEDSNALEYGEANGVARTVTKSSKFYNNASWDLVDAVSTDSLNINQMKKELLPEHLKNKSTSEIKAYIDSQKRARKRINTQIQELNKKRTAYLSQIQKKNTTSTLNDVMIKSLKKQAKQKNYQWQEK